MTRFFTTLFVCTILVLLSAQPASACRCGYAGPEELVQGTDMIFDAEVIKITGTPPHDMRATMQVSRVLKGKITDSLIMRYGEIGEMCELGKLNTGYKSRWFGWLESNGDVKVTSCSMAQYLTFDEFKREVDAILEEMTKDAE